MNRVSLHHLPRLLRLRRLASGVCAAGLPLLGWGCAGPTGILSERIVGPQVVFVQPGEGRVCHGGVVHDGPANQTNSPIRQVQATEATPAPVKTVRQVPITLDTVLRLAEEQNRQIALARERVNEACAEKNLAGLSWL